MRMCGRHSHRYTKLAINTLNDVLSRSLYFCTFCWLFMLLTNEQRSFAWNHSTFVSKKASTLRVNMLYILKCVYHSLVTKQLFSWIAAIPTLCYILRAVLFYLSPSFICFIFHVYINFIEQETQSCLPFFWDCWH